MILKFSVFHDIFNISPFLVVATRNKTHRHRPARVSTFANHAGYCFVTWLAKRDQVVINVFAPKPLIRFVMHFQLPFTAVVQARLAAVAVNGKSSRPLFLPQRPVINSHANSETLSEIRFFANSM